jgi:peptidoglycan/xylan/chitin deacetylase (PgdA/CDA1 family)
MLSPMRLLVLMYHRARAGRFGNAPEMLDAHFAAIASRHVNVLPGETLAPDALNVCLSFDDATFDFHAIVWPLLKKHGLRALLAVPVGVVRDHVSPSASARVVIEPEHAFINPDLGAFCTWPELAELAASGHVAFAAHGFTHRRLDDPAADLNHEVKDPKALLVERLRQPITSFVFPFGRTSPRALEVANQNYRHTFRIGSASNPSWTARALYRVDADMMATPTALFAPARLAAYRARYFWNRLRRR